MMCSFLIFSKSIGDKVNSSFSFKKKYFEKLKKDILQRDVAVTVM